MLRNSAVEAGLPPDFCDLPESSWEHNGVVWAESAGDNHKRRFPFIGNVESTVVLRRTRGQRRR